MMLLVETVSEEAMKWMLPINVLRNYALMAARTRLVAMVDVDLLPSAGLADWMLQPGKWVSLHTPGQGSAAAENSGWACRPRIMLAQRSSSYASCKPCCRTHMQRPSVTDAVVPFLPCSLDYLEQECSQSKVFVLPAFETAPLPSTEEAHALANTAAAQSKEGLAKMVEKQQLWQFALKIFKAVRTLAGFDESYVADRVVRVPGSAPAMRLPAP